MATKYVDSNASGSNDGTSWTNAWTSISSATGVAAGDVVKVEYRHVDRPASSQTHNFSNGTRANPVIIVSVDKDASDALRTGAVIGTATSNYYELKITGHVYIYGCTLEAGYRVHLAYARVTQRLESCTLKPDTKDQTAVGQLYFGDIANSGYISGILSLVNCTYSPPGTFISIGICGGLVCEIKNLTITGSPGSTTLFDVDTPDGDLGNPLILDVSDSDLSAVTNIFDAAQNHVFSVVSIKRCKVHASAVYAYGTKAAHFGRVMAEQCDDGTITVPPLGLTSLDTYQGKVSTSLAQYRTGGANDGEQANAYSWAMETSANALEIFGPLESPPMARWVEPDASISSATAKGIRTSTRCSPLATPAALTTDSGSTWNGTGVGTKQKITHALTNGSTLTVYVASGATLNDDDFWIEVSEPDQVGGPASVRCCLAKPSTTVYVDPRLEVA